MSEYIDDVIDHKNKVAKLMLDVTGQLHTRAVFHDSSKFSAEEADIYEQVLPKLKQAKYSTEEYYQAVEELGPALTHHYHENTHHPEHYENGVSGMNLLDVIEMVCDWMAAASRPGGDIATSLPVNKARFGIGDQLFDIIKNTVKLLDEGKQQ